MTNSDYLAQMKQNAQKARKTRLEKYGGEEGLREEYKRMAELSHEARRAKKDDLEKKVPLPKVKRVLPKK